jgi:hypothetical protein
MVPRGAACIEARSLIMTSLRPLTSPTAHPHTTLPKQASWVGHNDPQAARMCGASCALAHFSALLLLVVLTACRALHRLQKVSRWQQRQLARCLAVAVVACGRRCHRRR